MYLLCFSCAGPHRRSYCRSARTKQGSYPLRFRFFRRFLPVPLFHVFCFCCCRRLLVQHSRLVLGLILHVFFLAPCPCQLAFSAAVSQPSAHARVSIAFRGHMNLCFLLSLFRASLGAFPLNSYVLYRARFEFSPAACLRRRLFFCVYVEWNVLVDRPLVLAHHVLLSRVCGTSVD